MEAAETIDPRSFACGRPRKTDMRAAMNAIFFLLRTGCPWRYLPRDEFPPRSTVYNIFRKFQKDGVWEAILEELHAALREQLGREASPTAAVIDSQTLKAAGKGAVLMARQAMTPERRSRGARFHALADTEGLPLRAVVHSAGIQDRDGAALVLDKIHNRFPWLELVWADNGTNAWQVKAAVAKVPVLRLEIVKRGDGIKGFAVLPRRWVVERTFSWSGRNRRIAKDYENPGLIPAAFVTLACIQIAVRRLAR